MEEEKRQRDEEMVARQGPRVYRLAFAQLRSKADAEDVFQKVFLRYVEKEPAFESQEHEKAWFLRVTLNCCRNVWRAPWHKRHVPLDESLPFETRDQWGLHQELLKLPPKYRVVLHLFYWEDLPAAEIGRITGAKPAAVRQRLKRARAMMKEILEEEGLQNV